MDLQLFNVLTWIRMNAQDAAGAVREDADGLLTPRQIT